jgi:transcriptional regulator with XRE-family HTH domain
MSSKVAEKMSFTPAQCRAARALLSWSQAQLAEASRVATKTIADFEREDRVPYDRTLNDIREALEVAAIEFTNGDNPGVRRRGDRTFGHLYDDKGHVGWIKDGEFRAGRDKRLIALVSEGRLHDPKTGEFICNLAGFGVRGQPLPEALKSRLD